jgi:hypothetical protein
MAWGRNRDTVATGDSFRNGVISDDTNNTLFLKLLIFVVGWEFSNYKDNTIFSYIMKYNLIYL